MSAVGSQPAVERAPIPSGATQSVDDAAAEVALAGTR